MTRREARALRRRIAPDARHEKSLAIAAHLLLWPPYRDAKTVMAYVSVGAEVETGALLEMILSAGKRLALPRCKPDGIMEAPHSSTLDCLRPGLWGIPEHPQDTPSLSKADIDLILVPGLLFDAHGDRLGQGGGYYDRFLADFAGMTCGLAFAAQTVLKLAARPHDVPVRALATEEGIRLFGHGRNSS